jgi:hypothetical protein
MPQVYIKDSHLEENGRPSSETALALLATRGKMKSTGYKGRV